MMWKKLGSHKVRLHMSAPDVSVAHRLYAYPTQQVHRSFDDTGANLTKNGIGTGAFKLDFYRVGEGAQIVRRPAIGAVLRGKAMLIWMPCTLLI